jgi:hypothetical protein
MHRILRTAVLTLAIASAALPGVCADPAPQDSPWETLSLNAGMFVSTINSSFRLGSGVGVDIDPERLLDLDAASTVFRVDGSWRFSDNRRHRTDLSWFSFRRSGSKTVGKDITLENPKTGEVVDIPAGSEIRGNFDLDIYQLAYSYSFLQDDRIDLAAQLGLYVMPIDVGFSVAGLIEDSASASFTAPLPTGGLRLDFALAPDWYLRSASQVFYLEYQQFKGSLVAFRAAVEYTPWDHLGLGLGFDTFRCRLEARGEDYPSVDIRGNLEFSYVGAQLYAKVYF